MAEQFTVPAQESPAEAPEVQSEDTPTRPEWLPEKFWDSENNTPKVEDLSKSYAELEKQFSETRETQKTQEIETPETPTNLDLDKYHQEFMANGELSTDAYEELSSLGISKEVVDQYIEGIKAKAQGVESQMYEIVGGQENYQKMSKWAKEHLNEGDLVAYNKAMESASVHEIEMAVHGLHARFIQANGKTPQLIEGENRTVKTGEVYGDMSQVVKDMQSADYKASPAFRNKVQEKLARSSL